MKTTLIILSLVLASLIVVQTHTVTKAESLKTLIQPPTSGHWKNPIPFFLVWIDCVISDVG